MRQDSWNRKTWAGQPEQENLGRTAGTGKPGQDSRNRKTWTGQPEQEILDVTAGKEQSEKTFRMVQAEQERVDRMART
jgi:hypothetical protein